MTKCELDEIAAAMRTTMPTSQKDLLLYCKGLSDGIMATIKVIRDFLNREKKAVLFAKSSATYSTTQR